MKCLIQKVNFASVEVNNEIVSEIKNGLLVLYGISEENFKLSGKEINKKIDSIVNRLLNLRVFENKNGENFKTSVVDNNYEILIVSQFTLFGDIKKSNKPNFYKAMNSDNAKIIYEKLVKKLKDSLNERLKEGVFGAHMKIKLENNGPVTLLLEK